MAILVWFQSPSNRVNIPNPDLTYADLTDVDLCFNPLVIGSIFQTNNTYYDQEAGTPGFQSPSNRVNIPNGCT